MDNLLKTSIDDPYYAVRMFFNLLYIGHNYYANSFLDAIYGLTKKIDMQYEGISINFHDKDRQPFEKEVNFQCERLEAVKAACDIMLPLEIYKQLTLEAIDAFQSEHFHEGLAKARRQFLPEDISINQKNDAAIIEAENQTFDVPIIGLKKTIFDAIYDKTDPYWSLCYCINIIYNEGNFINVIEQFINKMDYYDDSLGVADSLRIEFKDRNFYPSPKTVMLTLGSYLDYVIFMPFEMFSTILLEAIDIYQSKHYRKTLVLYRQYLSQIDDETRCNNFNENFHPLNLKDDDYE